mmetsp:Transcript_65582/g.122272  ORF Transcript_65582/g.122272 Transcript_65582/m.122272 type:complete len:166 (-) Transcript_65582:7-504(-)
MLNFPKVKRRTTEVFSGYAFMQLDAVRRELGSPSLTTELERERLRDCRGYVGQITTAAASAVGVYYLGRCFGIARLEHRAASFHNRALGLAVAVPWFVIVAGATAYYRYAEVLDETMCPNSVDTDFAAFLRDKSRAKAPALTRQFLKDWDRKVAVQGLASPPEAS